MGDSIPGAAVNAVRRRFGKKMSSKPRRMILPEGVRLLPAGGGFELIVNESPVGIFDGPSSAIDHLVSTGRIVAEKVKEQPKPEHDFAYEPGPDGGTNLYCNGEFEGFFADIASAKQYVREFRRERRRESLRRLGNYWD